MKNIEVEVRSFVSQERFGQLMDFFKKEASFLGEDFQETHYFDGPTDFRIQRNNSFSKLWLKGGKLHDDSREETEIRFERSDFEKLGRLLGILGFRVKVKWFRTRNSFQWDGIDVALDFTKGYGHILELEKMVLEPEKEKALQLLRRKMAELNVPITPREEFERKFRHYEQNWETLTK